jgi:hypothetical protein
MKKDETSYSMRLFFPHYFFNERLPVGSADRHLIFFDKHIVIIERIDLFFVHDIGSVDAWEYVFCQQFPYIFQSHSCNNPLPVAVSDVIFEYLDEEDIFDIYFEILPVGFDEDIIVFAVSRYFFLLLSLPSNLLLFLFFLLISFKKYPGQPSLTGDTGQQ